MRYFSRLAGEKEPTPLEVEPLGTNQYAVTLRGKRHIVDALTLDHGAVSLLVDGYSYSVELTEQENELSVLVNSQVTQVDIADERRLRLQAARAGFFVSGKQTIVAPMPGKVVKLLVKAGDEVVEGQGLVVVEAMKMENELKSPKAGKVTQISVREGDAVEQNANLLTVE